ncbi:MAG: GDP-mannose 4,6-dehydratase [Ardenticatenales bacterium]|nr:GDP-mannose 4,6-dehydratase [Ardenticatenales bacterium]MCB9171913.1 GDP-mannose 4,6-dehydratase [Ardenticatenales bacterium]
MDYLITGGAGFIGSHLTEALLARGDGVVVLDDLSTGSIRNIEPFRDNPRFNYQIDTVENRSLVAELVDRVDAVFHLAAAVGVRLVVENPVRTLETNLRTTEVVLEMANKKQRPVLLASTSEVYGKSTKVPFHEDDPSAIGPPTLSRWGYACSKLMDEFLGQAYWHEYGLPVIVVRYFNTVGPRQTGRYGMVLPTFVRQALANQPLTVHGDGAQTRSFGYVGDVVRGSMALMDAGERAHGAIVNLGNEEEISIRALAERVVARAESRSEIVLIPYDQAYGAGFEDMQRRVPDLSRAEALVGYAPQVGLDAIIDHVIAHYRTGGQL